jgi:hypothetical protein
VWQVGVKVWGGDSASEAGTGVANGWLEHVHGKRLQGGIWLGRYETQRYQLGT